MDEEKEYYALTRRVFDYLAPVYNVMTLPLVKVRDQVVDFADATAEAAVLDVATGTGQQAFAFAKCGCDVTAIDLTESMLAVARKRNRAGLVKFEVANATHLRFNADCFDIACVSFALHDMPLPIREQVLKEMARVTRSGGVILVIDYDLPRNRWGRSLVYRFVSLYEGKYYAQFIASDLRELLKQTGCELWDERSVLGGAARMWKSVKRS